MQHHCNHCHLHKYGHASVAQPATSAAPATPPQPAVPPAAPIRASLRASKSRKMLLQVVVVVDNSLNESTFQVERCAGSSCTVFVVVLTAASSSVATTGTAYSVTDIAPSVGVVYRYRVLACSAASGMCSGPSVVLTATSLK